MNQQPVTSPGGVESAHRPIWTALVCAMLAVAVLAAWSNSFHGAFVYDDLGAIRDNPTIRHFPSVRALMPPQQNTVARRPIVNLSLAINYAIGGSEVLGFHIGNLLIHLCAALLLFGVVRRALMNGRPTIDDGRRTISRDSIVNRPSSIVAVSFAVALIWAVHPLQTESVTYMIQRTESLAGLFYLLTLYCAIRGAASAHPWRWYSPAIAACAFGMGTKEVVATAPLIVLLYDRAFISGSFREALRRRRALYAGLAATWAVLGVLLIAYPWGAGTGAGFGLQAITAREYALTQPGVLLHYLRLAFWPHRLCLDYFWPAAKTAGQILPQAAVVAALVAGTIWALRRAPKIGMLGAWFFLILAPTLSIIPIQDPCFEHRMYLPLAAVVTASVLAASWIGGRLLRLATTSDEERNSLSRFAAIFAALSVAVALSCVTFARNRIYHDAIKIWQDTVDQRPDNVRAWTNLGYSYASVNRFTDAIEQYDQAIARDPKYALAYNNRAAACVSIGRYAQALADCATAIHLNAGPEAYVILGDVLTRTHERQKAFKAYDAAIDLMPGQPKAYDHRALAFVEAGRLNEALQDFDAAIARDPDYTEALCHRASAYTTLGRSDEAIRDCDRAIKINPANAEAYTNRAAAFHQLKEYDKALRDCEKAIRLAPDFAPAYANLGAVFYAMNRRLEAVASYTMAIKKMPDFADAYRNRGDVYFSGSYMLQAIQDYTKAIQLQPDSVEAYCGRAKAYIMLKIPQYEMAIADCDEAVKLKPDCAEAYGTRAAVNAAVEMYALVIPDCTKAIELKPDYAAAYNYRIYAYYQLKQYDKALEDVEIYRRLGGRPDAKFLKALLQAAGRAE